MYKVSKNMQCKHNIIFYDHKDEKKNLLREEVDIRRYKTVNLIQGDKE